MSFSNCSLYSPPPSSLFFVRFELKTFITSLLILAMCIKGVASQAGADLVTASNESSSL